MAMNNNFNNVSDSAAKRLRYEESAGFQKFKGVVPQQNGHWGAQIYANHQRIWLGTFKTEREAAMAYDSATIKLRSGESHRNFPWNDQTVQEPYFQSHYSTETVLAMIRDGTYPSKFTSFLRNQNHGVHNKEESLAKGCSNINKCIRIRGGEQFSCTQLFQKELTPSDVGKLNRLVIPKKHAVTYLPYVDGNSNNNNNATAETAECRGVDVEVVFYDKLMRSWKFRYCYWKSSQSYVFTRGWNRFVKDKKLKAKDIIAFYMCEPVNNSNDVHRQQSMFGLIDVIYNTEHDDTMHGNNNNVDVETMRKQVMGKSTINYRLGCSDVVVEDRGDYMEEDEDDEEEEHKVDGNSTNKSVRLFGVSIS
ncbi:hypothetical protein PIB30_055105 [Stylosanthes scabra]|uniref:Uncharacterized protein n=1 Tax=Stylosanthes scabra TaxID=79078 RepID=A0ABU6TIT0_9FABA|nr:hypothetical protein [Stylosanthes scabra]